MTVSTRLVGAPADWDALRARFRWPDWDEFNIAEAVCDRWARQAPGRLALIEPRDDGEDRRHTFRDLSRLSNKLANGLRASGVKKGDRIAVLLPQSIEALLTHLAAYKCGAIVVPLFTLFGPDGLAHRLSDSGTSLLVTDAANLEKVMSVREDLADLREILSVDGTVGEVRDFWATVFAGRSTFLPESTLADTPALLCYTSGTTGPPKGALHGHRFLIGHLPGVETHQDFFPQDGDCMWTPADWAWLGGLANALLPALFHGIPVVAKRLARFEPDAAYQLIRDTGVRNVFMPPTALRLMRQGVAPSDTGLRSIASGGEALGPDLLDWAREELNLTVNEFYGSTECNLVLGNSHTVFQPVPGSTGKAVPGSSVAIIDDAGNELPDGEMGLIAVKRGDPAMFLEYWNNPEKTDEKYRGDWMLLGDEGLRDAEGYFHFSSRSDDVIMSAGYRIGPSEIETCLASDPSVSLAAAIGVPDAERGEVVHAFVVLKDGAGFDGLEDHLINLVRDRISPHVAPKKIFEIKEMPMTATGKIMRRALKD